MKRVGTTVARLRVAPLVLVSLACSGEPGPRSSGDLRIVPQEPSAAQTLHAGGMQQAGSLGGDPTTAMQESSQLRWLINGNVIAHGEQLAAGSFHRGDVVELQRVRTGSVGRVEVLARDQVVIGNSAPRIESVRLVRSRENGMILECLVEAVDEDEDTLHLNYEWSINGRAQTDARSEFTSLRDVPKGSHVRVRVSASDGALRSQPVPAKPFLVDNLPPRLELSPEPTFEELGDGRRIVRFHVAVDDPDGDALAIELEGAPKDARYDAELGALRWVVRGTLGRTQVLVRVLDEKGASCEAWLRVPAEDVAGR